MHSIRFKEIEIKNLGPFKNLKINFNKRKTNPNRAETHILFGENSSGKTSILRILNIIGRRGYLENKDAINFSIHNGGVFINTKLDTTVQNDTNFDFKIVIENESNEEDIYTREVFENLIANDDSRINSSFYGNKIFYFDSFRNDNTQRPLFEITDGTETETTKKLTSSRIRDIFSINNEIEYYANNENKIRIKRSLETANELIRKIIEDDSFLLYLDEDSNQVKVKFRQSAFNTYTLADGIKAICNWLPKLINELPNQDRTSSFILLMDEIEVHMNPQWQRLILNQLSSFFPNAQIIVTTHSPWVIGSIDGAFLYKLNYNKVTSTSEIEKGYPLPSEDQTSYMSIIREQFNINGHFGVEVEKSINELKLLVKKETNSFTEEDKKGFEQIVKNLTSSPETDIIVRNIIINALKK